MIEIDTASAAKRDSATASSCVTEDRRSTRSKNMLRTALAQLIEERGLDGFSVSDLTERADLNRGTFYAHYKDKDDLLHCFEEEIFDGLMDIQAKMSDITLNELFLAYTAGIPLSLSVELFDYLRAHGAFLGALLGPNGDPGFQARLRDLVCTNMVQAVLHEKYRVDPAPLTEYYTAYYASAHLGMIQQWLDRGMVESSEDMAGMMIAIMFMRPGDPIEMKKGGLL